MLTAKQADLLTYLKGRGSPSPSFEEMKEALNLKSKSGVHRLINALEERGFIRRLPNRARAIEVIRNPELPEVYKVHLRKASLSELRNEMKRRGYIVVKFT